MPQKAKQLTISVINKRKNVIYMERRRLFIVATAALSLALAGCKDKQKDYDATGTFEATETIVSAEQTGMLVEFSPAEGDEIAAGTEVGLIDTTQLQLRLRQLDATKAVYNSQRPDMQKQVAATRQQLQKAQQEQQRYKELVADGAAPSKMLDDAKNQVSVLQRQLDAQISALNTQLSTISSQSTAVEAEKNLLRDQLRKCHITVPTAGTVLEKYVERGEFVAAGKPLLKIADTRNMFIRAYITSSQLQQLKVGQSVKVLADFGGGQRKEFDGKVTWISSRSEFTPKTILTDDERADQVYAVKIAFENNGEAKIGMYGQVRF